MKSCVALVLWISVLMKIWRLPGFRPTILMVMVMRGSFCFRQ